MGTLRILDYPFGDFRERLREGLNLMSQANIALTPTVRQFQYVADRLRLMEGTSNSGTSNIKLLVATPNLSWDDRRRSDTILLSVDMLDVTASILEMAPTWGKPFAVASLEGLLGLEQTYAARWGTEFVDVLCMLAGKSKPASTGASSGTGRRRRRRPKPAGGKKPKGSLQQLFKDGVDLAKDLMQRSNRSGAGIVTGQTLVVMPFHEGAFAYAGVQGLLASVGTELLSESAEHRSARKMVRRLRRYLAEASGPAGVQAAIDLSRETERLYRLLAKARQLSQ